MRRLLAIWIGVAALSYPASVPAHRSAAREMVLQLDARGAVILWHMRVVGPKATLMTAVWDRDRNGVLDDQESAGVALSLLATAARGVTVTWDGQPVPTTALEPRLDSVGERSVAAVGLASVSLPPPTAGAHTVRIELADNSGPLAFQIQVLDAWRLEDSALALAPDDRGLAKPLLLAPGRAVELRVSGGVGTP